MIIYYGETIKLFINILTKARQIDLYVTAAEIVSFLLMKEKKRRNKLLLFSKT